MPAYVTRVTADLDCLAGEPDQRWTIEVRRETPEWQPSALDVPPDVRNALIAWANGDADAQRILDDTK